MSYTKEIVCLANSRRPGGHCIAGKEVNGAEFGRWMRPISSAGGEGLGDSEICCKDGQAPGILDVVRISLKRHVRQGHQTENYVIDADKRWERTEKVPYSRVPELTDRVVKLWTNGFESDYGINDRIPCDKIDKIDTSLLFIQPSQLVIHHAYEFGAKKWRTRADFVFNKVRYSLVVTDPAIEEMYRHKPAGDFPVKSKPIYLTISLGQDFNGFCYKLVAGIILPPKK